MTCIIAYDIEDNKIRARLARYLETIGIRIQKSVFAVEIERHTFRRMLGRIRAITGDTGNVAVFRLCVGCQKNALKFEQETGESFHVF